MNNSLFTLIDESGEKQKDLTVLELVGAIADTPGRYIIKDQVSDSSWQMLLWLMGTKYIAMPKEPYGAVDQIQEVIDLHKERTVEDVSENHDIFLHNDKIREVAIDTWETCNDLLLESFYKDDSYHNNKARAICTVLQRDGRRELSGHFYQACEAEKAEKYNYDAFDLESFTQRLEEEVQNALEDSSG